MMSPYLHLPILVLALGVTANPLPEELRPPPTSTSTLTKPCTTYITKIIPGMYRPETVYTVYTATQTVYSLVPCKGCVLATTTLYAPGAGGGGGGGGWPYDETTTTTTATAPFKTTSTICIPSHHPTLPTVLRRQIRDPPPPKTKTKGQNCPESTFPVPTSTDSSTNKPVIEITLPGGGPGRTNPIEPTTTYAILRARETPLFNYPEIVAATTTITLTLTSKSWSATTTSTRSTTCFYGPYQDPDPGAIPKRKRDAVTGGCSTAVPRTTVYRTTLVVVPETGTLTRTTVKCTRTVPTRRPKPTLTPDVGGGGGGGLD